MIYVALATIHTKLLTSMNMEMKNDIRYWILQGIQIGDRALVFRYLNAFNRIKSTVCSNGVQMKLKA